mmetsp:Transcript_14662/g.23294  ORF Transcript_14662/g.23294 Transcript_14662/m.23294 type:complete len:183 (-) Transcript_14662:254-802(-)
MEAGKDMLYPVQCIDGAVHMYAGKELRAYLQEKHPSGCEVSEAVASPSFGSIPYSYGIVHAVAPTASMNQWRKKLKDTYINALNRAVDVWNTRTANIIKGKNETVKIATPFLGTGAKGIGLLEGAKAASAAIAEVVHQEEYVPSSFPASDTCSFFTVRFSLIDDAEVASITETMSQSLGMPD